MFWVKTVSQPALDWGGGRGCAASLRLHKLSRFFQKLKITKNGFVLLSERRIPLKLFDGLEKFLLELTYPEKSKIVQLYHWARIPHLVTCGGLQIRCREEWRFLSGSVGLSVDRAALSPGRGGAGKALLGGFWAGAVLAVVVGRRRRGAGGRGRGGRGLGLLLKVCYDDCQVAHRHLQVLGAAPVDVF